MEKELLGLLEDGVSRIDSKLCTDTVLRRLSRLYDEISLFNPSYGLVNARGRDLVIRHILDCLAPVGIIISGSSAPRPRMADLGSGSGLPGLVLASVLEDWDISLVERMGRRAGFLRNTVAAMGMSRSVKVEQKDLSKVQNSYDIITFRAFRQFKDIISDLDRILVPGGKVFAYKSSEENIQEETEVIRSYSGCRFTTEVCDYEVPMLDAKRRMLILTKD